MDKIGICTVYTGFNYGSSLQAYASKKYISNLGYDVDILTYKDGLVKGRDIRIKKLLIMFLRTFWRPKLFRKTFLTYRNSLKKELDLESKRYFFDFEKNNLSPKQLSWKELKKFANNNNTLACICGSDQIWNATNIYIDPIFYLRFAPKKKRIAYAPSFGKSSIPKYNVEIIKKYISDFKYISVREEEGEKIVFDLINREVTSLIDPTLLLRKSEWLENFGIRDGSEKYILLYFLDKPTKIALKYIRKILDDTNFKVKIIHNNHEEYNGLDFEIDYISAGPKEFVKLINNAAFVCTDSFHGMVFSINLNTPFYIFKRDYGVASDQSTRIVSLLNKISLNKRFIYDLKQIKDIDINLNFELTNKLLDNERNKSRIYLINALTDIKSNRRKL